MSLQELKTHIINTVNSLNDEEKLEALAGIADRISAQPAEADSGITDEMYAAALRGRAQIAAGNYYTIEQLDERIKATIETVAKRKQENA